jgi:hypothetical protein
VSVKFRGVMQRTDGSRLAWIEVKDGAGKKSSFFRTNDVIHGLRIDAISSTGSVSLIRTDGTAIELGVGAQESLTRERKDEAL